MSSIEDRVAAAMTAPLDAVVVAEREVRPPEDVVCQGDLPESDRRALLRWGLPSDDHMRPLFQTGPDPALVPNLAGERERQAASPGERLYTLVHWGSEELQLRIGAVAGTGRVLKIQPRPTTVDDLPPGCGKPTPACTTRPWSSSAPR
jgi:hypothetical protein